MLNPEKIRHQHLAEICPPRLSDVATLPLEIQKSFSTALKHSLEAVSHAEPMQNLHRRGQRNLACEISAYTGWVKKWGHGLMTIIPSNVNRFQNNFH